MMFLVNVDLNVTFPQQIEHLEEKTFRWLPLHSFKILIGMFFFYVFQYSKGKKDIFSNYMCIVKLFKKFTAI